MMWYGNERRMKSRHVAIFIEREKERESETCCDEMSTLICNEFSVSNSYRDSTTWSLGCSRVLLLRFFETKTRCTSCTACLVGCCAPDSEGAQECSGEAGRAARACFSIAHTIWRGIMSTKVIAMGCMVAQQFHEIENSATVAPKNDEMER